jgi:hypothetical protein
MKENEISSEVEIDRLKKEEKSGWKSTIDLMKLKSIVMVYRKKKKWMKANDRSSEVDRDG